MILTALIWIVHNFLSQYQEQQNEGTKREEKGGKNTDFISFFFCILSMPHCMVDGASLTESISNVQSVVHNIWMSCLCPLGLLNLTNPKKVCTVTKHVKAIGHFDYTTLWQLALGHTKRFEIDTSSEDVSFAILFTIHLHKSKACKIQNDSQDSGSMQDADAKRPWLISQQ